MINFVCDLNDCCLDVDIMDFNDRVPVCSENADMECIKNEFSISI